MLVTLQNELSLTKPSDWRILPCAATEVHLADTYVLLSAANLTSCGDLHQSESELIAV